MTTFKKFGGLNYNSKNNIVSSFRNHTTTHSVSNHVGDKNTRIVHDSHIDLSGNSVLRVNGIYFVDGTVQTTAVTGSSTGGSSTGGSTSSSNGGGIQGPPGPPGPPGPAGSNTTLSDKNHNTFGGTNALLVRDNELAKYNNAYGERVLMKNTAGYANSAFGFEAMVNNMSGAFNTAVGTQALAFNIAGTRNTCVGAAADVGNAGIHNSTAIGAGARVYASNVIQLGNATIEHVITTGIITGKAKNFTIPHPLQHMSTTHVLKHASVEAPRLDLIYRDTVRLVHGRAEVHMDKHFNMSDGTFSALGCNPSVFVSNESDWDQVKGCMDMGSATLHITCKNNESCSDVAFMVVVERKDDGIMLSDITDEEGRFIPEKKREGLDTLD